MKLAVKVIVALQGIFNPNCRVGSLFQSPPSYVFANFDVLGEWKMLLMMTEISIEIISKQLRQET